MIAPQHSLRGGGGGARVFSSRRDPVFSCSVNRDSIKKNSSVNHD